MTQHTRSVLIGLVLGLATSASGQSLVEVATTTSIQNTLQSINTAQNLKVPTVPTAPGAPADEPATAVPAGTAPANTVPASTVPANTLPATSAPAAPAIAVTPLTPGQQAQLQVAQTAFRAGDYSKARRVFEQLVSQNYNNPEPHFGLALALLAQKDDRGAAFELTQFVALAPDRYEGPYNLGVIATRAGNHEQALTLYTQAATLMTGKATPTAQRQVLEALAAGQTRKADFVALSTTLAQITVLDPKDLDAQYRLAQARTLAGQGASALPGVYALLKSSPARLDGALLLADIYVAQGLPDRALRELNAAIFRVKTGSERSELLLRKANILAAGGDTHGAVLSAQNATRENGRSAVAFARLGELRSLRNDRPGALVAYQNAVKLSPQSAAYRVAMAGVRLTLNQNAEAALDAAQVLKLRPDPATLARAQYIQGVAAYRQENYTQAITALKSSLAHTPSADTAMWLGLSSYALKDYPGAASALAESVKLNPAPTTRMNLASALLASTRYAEAEAVLRGLVTDAPKNAEAWFMLGLAQRAQLREQDARVSLKTAATLGSVKAQGAIK